MKHLVNLSSRKYFTPSIFLIFFLIFNLGVNKKIDSQSIYSTNQNITVNDHGTFTYCIGDPVDHLVGYHPHRDFAGPGINNRIADDGLATFDPAIAGIGSWNITYHGTWWTFVVTDDPVPPTLAPFGTYCSYSPAFTLTGGLTC